MVGRAYLPPLAYRLLVFLPKTPFRRGASGFKDLVSHTEDFLRGVVTRSTASRAVAVE
jgi:hypothetical protein